MSIPNPSSVGDGPASETGQQAPPPSMIRLRAFIAAVLIIPLDNYWVLMMEKARFGPYPTTISIFANVVFILTVLTAVNALVRKLKPRQAFTMSELLLIYIMVAVAAALAGHDLMPTLVGMMTYPFVFATVENQWAQNWDKLPQWLLVPDVDVARPLWEGYSNLYDPGIWQAWVKPAAYWVLFIVILMFTMQCINTLVRKSWADHERLPFPLIQLPIAMTEPNMELWRNKLFWIGFAIPATIVLINGLAVYFPSIPMLHVGHQDRNIMANVTAKPWDALGWTPFTLHPFVLGIGFLLRADLLFSCVFFYWFWKFQMVFTSALALDANPQFPYIRQQAFGGYMAIVLTMLIISRGYWKQVWLKVIGKPSEVDDSQEGVSYRFAVLGGLAGLLFLCWFFVTIGLSWWLAIIAFLIYFMMALAITRIRAELGPPVHDGHSSGPDGIMIDSLGSDAYRDSDYVGMSYFYWFNRAYRAHPMPIGLEGMQMAQTSGASQSKFFWGVILAVFVGAVATFWGYLHMGYAEGFQIGIQQGGAYSWSPQYALQRWLNRPPEGIPPDMNANAAILFGLIFCVFLWFMHLNVIGWPFHPIGFAITSSYAINLLWFPLLLAWIIKVTMLKFGGLQLYRKALPFFLGLIVGEMVPGCMWSIVGFMFDVPYYNFWGA